VDEHPSAGGVERVERLRKVGADHSGEHIAGPGGGERGGVAAADPDPPVWLGDDRVIPLEHDDCVSVGSGPPRMVQAPRLHDLAGLTEQPGQLPGVWRQDRGGAALGERL